MKIYKHIYDTSQETNTIKNCVAILSVGVQQNKPVIWFQHNEAFHDVEIKCYVTGQDCYEVEEDFIGTAILNDASFILHFFK